MGNLNNVEVRDSTIAGRGLFAKRDFVQGEVVLAWNSDNVYLSEEELASLSDELKQYVAIYNDQYLLIPAPERYMNHSCEPNTETNDEGEDVATRDILAGEEVTGDYRRIPTLLGFVCRCGTAQCAHTILGHG